MRQTLQKIKSLGPVVKVRQSELDKQLGMLAQIRNEKVNVVKAMKEKQRAYMDGVEELNRVRNSAERSNLLNLEDALSFVKSEWYRLYREVQSIEEKEKQQITQVLEAERNLKMAEKLRDTYKDTVTQEAARAEQKQLDEFALRRFMSRT